MSLIFSRVKNVYIDLVCSRIEKVAMAFFQTSVEKVEIFTGTGGPFLDGMLLAYS